MGLREGAVGCGRLGVCGSTVVLALSCFETLLSLEDTLYDEIYKFVSRSEKFSLMLCYDTGENHCPCMTKQPERSIEATGIAFFRININKHRK